MIMKSFMLAAAMTFGLGTSLAFAQAVSDEDTASNDAQETASDGKRVLQRPASTQSYTVRSGDSLSRIARYFYGNSVLWQPILNANEGKIKAGGRLIYPGTTLVIPNLGGESPEIEAALSDTGKPILLMVTGNDYAPFTDKGLPQGGMFTEIARTAASRAGYDSELEFLPWDYAMRATEKGTFKASFPWYKNPDREAGLWFSRPVYEVLIVVYRKTGTPLKVEGIEDLNGLNLCRPAGYFDDDIKEKVEAGQIVRTAPETPSDCFELLVKGDVDVVSLSAMVGNSEIIRMGYEGKVDVGDIPLSIRPLHIVYPKFDPRSRGTMAKVDRELRDMDEDGTTAAIIERHLREHFTKLTEMAAAKAE